MRIHARRVILVVVLTLVGGGAASSATLALQQREARLSAATAREHLIAFQRIADRHGGTRAAGTAGYAASAQYVARRMRAAGYAVRLQAFSFQYVADRAPPLLEISGRRAADVRANRDYATLTYSGDARVEAGVVAVDLLVPSPRPNASTSGCEATDFAGFSRGAVALLQRGSCTFREKVANAVAAGASGAIVFNEGNPGRRELFRGGLGPPQASIPAISASFDVGQMLRNEHRDGVTGTGVVLETDVIAETRRSSNVIAESRTGDASDLVVAGAHLDSVEGGPGINDNGSGSAVLVEVAERLASLRPHNRLRFAWWGAEELGLIGSRHYVSHLSAAARENHALYLNLDMVGSPNHVFFVYDGDGSQGRPVGPPGSGVVERVLSRSLVERRISFQQTQLGGSSDHASFVAARIPVGGLFTGADGEKSQEQAAVFGGRAGRPYDPCYHRACDRLANVSDSALAQSTLVTADVLRTFARDVSPVRTSR